MTDAQWKTLVIYHVGFFGSRNDKGKATFFERAFAFEPEMSSDEIKTYLCCKLPNITSVEYVDEVDRDVMWMREIECIDEE